MKTNTIFIITILGLLILVSCKPIVNNIYCLGVTTNTSQTVGERSSVPESLKLDNTSIYYQMDDNTNFQTLAFAVDIDNAYTIIGRFNGKYLPNDMYQIDSLEFVAYNLFSKKRNTYKVKDVSVENNENIVTFKVFLDSNAGSDSASKDVDYTYKTNNDAPIIVNRSTVLSFDVEDIDGNKSLPGGGYECRGLPSYRGRSR